MRIIDGKALAEAHLAELIRLIAAAGRPPGLAIILVGDDPASQLYVRIKERACERVGMHFEKTLLPASAADRDVLSAITALNARPDIHGIVVQLPLPTGLDENEIIAALDPVKDVDGFHPDNLARLERNQPRIIPALTESILDLITSTGQPIAGARAAILANSEIFARPTIARLRFLGARAEYVGDAITDSRVKQADIVIIALGRPGCLMAAHVKPAAVIIDVGITKTDQGVCGDADRDSFAATDVWLTPVPGGVGPMTVAHLLLNTYQAAQRQRTQ